MEAGYLKVRVASLLADQAERIAAEIERIDERLASLGEGEEDRLEAIVLRALRRHLEGELASITEYLSMWDEWPEAPAAVHA